MTLKVGIIGATGMVGQRFISLLQDHPTFRVSEVIASQRSAGKKYADAVKWVLDEDRPTHVDDLDVKLASDELDCDMLFSAAPGGLAHQMELDLAKRGYHVFSNAKDHRWTADAPLLLPEVNSAHLPLVEQQKTDGKIMTGGNCSTITMTMALAPLHEAFGLQKAVVCTYQALSGAGWPGVPSMAIGGNILPYIGGEEDKIENEARRFLGTYTGREIALANFAVSATAVRVPVLEGHTCAVSATFRDAPTPEAAAEVLRNWRPEPQQLKLPSAPERPVIVRTEDDRPQPRKDAHAGHGMSATVGRLRADPVMGLKFVVCASNTIRGAAGTNILSAELFAQRYL